MLHNFSESRHIIYSFLSHLKMYTYMRINARVAFKLDTGWRHLYQFRHFFRLVGWVFSTFWFSLSWSIELMILTQSENYTNFLRILNIHLSYESAFLHNWQGGATKDSVSIEYVYISKNMKKIYHSRSRRFGVIKGAFEIREVTWFLHPFKNNRAIVLATGRRITDLTINR